MSFADWKYASTPIRVPKRISFKAILKRYEERLKREQVAVKKMLKLLFGDK
jgi:hypothetical protein